MINKIVNTLVVVLFLASVGLNVFFLMGKGINIDKSTTVHQHQEQFQGQLMINQYYHKGNKIEWELRKFPFERPEELISYLNSLHPTSSYFTKITFVAGTLKFYVYTPNFLELKKK